MMTLIQDFTHQINAELVILNSNEEINSFLRSAEQKLGIKREYIIYCNVNLLYFFYNYLIIFSFRCIQYSYHLFNLWFEQ